MRKIRIHNSLFMNRLLILMITVSQYNLTLFSQQHHAPSYQSNLIRHYPFNNNSYKDVKNNKNGSANGVISSTEDRFGNANGAIKFEFQGAFIDLPNLFEGADISSGYSLSFWIKVNDPLSHRDGAGYPYTSDDEISQIIYGRKVFDETTGSASTVFGIQRIRDRLVVNRAVNNQPFGLWFWDPANLASDSGDGLNWHFVTLVQGRNFMRIFVGKPGRETLDCRANYFPIQDLSDFADWGIGGIGNMKSIHAIDDFKVYSQVLSESQVNAIFSAESTGLIQPRTKAFHIARSNNHGDITKTAAGVGVPVATIATTIVIGVIFKYKSKIIRASRTNASNEEEEGLLENQNQATYETRMKVSDDETDFSGNCD